MPVIGHAFVGLGTAVCTRDRVRPSIPAVLWGPLLVGLAYLPDIVGQGVTLWGGGNVSFISHSICFAMVVSPAIGAALARLGTTSFRGGTVICLFSILTHDGLDLMQSTNRQPWWPISDQPVGAGLQIIPMNSIAEGLLFGAAFGVFVAIRAARRRRAQRRGQTTAANPPSPAWAVWTNRVLIAMILVSASATHYLRGIRNVDYAEVRAANARGDHADALVAADRAERWPSIAKPGRLDCARGEAYMGLGDHPRAEIALDKGLQVDPHYFWGWADMALLQASSDKPAAERRRAVETCVNILKREFADHEALPRNLDRIERYLNRD